MTPTMRTRTEKSRNGKEPASVRKIKRVRKDIKQSVTGPSCDLAGGQIMGAILENSPVAMFVIDRKHRVLFWNRALEKLSGVAASEMVGTDHHWKIFYRERNLTVADLLVDETIDTGEDLLSSYETRLGKYRKSDLLNEAYELTDFFPAFGEKGSWLHITCAAIRDQEGNIFGAVETFEDITRQVRAEELNRTVADRSPVGVYVAQRGRFIFANEQFRRYFGYSEKELGGMDPLDLIHPDDRERVKQECKLMLEGARTSAYEFRAVAKNGDVRWIMENVSLIDYQGRRAILGNDLDITAKKQSELEMEHIRAVEISILDAIPVAVVGLKDRRVIFANHSVEDIFGWKPEELIGQTTRVLYRSEEEFEKIGEDFYPVLKKEKTFRKEFTCRRKDGQEIICIVGASRVGESMADRTIVATYENITEQKTAEANLKRSYERLKRSMEDTIQTIAMIVEARDPYTAGHQRAVDRLALAIAAEMKLDEDMINGIHTASVIHDIGKIYIPAEMLSKPGHLSEIEYDIMKTHPQVSYDILKRIDFPWPVANIVYQHHERYNGSGYPRGLKGDEILLAARILAVADVVESMASHRPYRPTVGMDKAIEEIKKNRGILYDAEVVDACLKVLSGGFKFE